MSAAIAILQTIKTDAELLLGQLNSSSSRLYEISTSGAIVERTTQARQHYRNLIEQLQHVIDLLREK